MTPLAPRCPCGLPLHDEVNNLRAEVEVWKREHAKAHGDWMETRKKAAEALAERDALKAALKVIERTGAPGGTIVVRRSDGHSCSWCRGMVTPCPVVTAREALGEVEK